ncbi:hypothetical protein DFH07DRAFT_777721 [Mycena maculata]|uniref:Uncharacterized protein n=1 Tax=Mycena maculata TaxID=230809 RepID=A0AAD7IHH7_9AGAR|nr:hypothetical protein DFH07DRAFT_777721 [Mycena maculata]
MSPHPLTSKRHKGPTTYKLKLVVFWLFSFYSISTEFSARTTAENKLVYEWQGSTRAALKSRPKEDQDRAAERARAYQAKYRAKHREDLRMWEAQRRVKVYIHRYGYKAYSEYAQAKVERKCRALEKRLAREGCDDHIGNAPDDTRITS